MNNNKREKNHEFLSIFSSQIFNQRKDNRIKIYFQNFLSFHKSISMKIFSLSYPKRGKKGKKYVHSFMYEQ